MLMTPRCGGHFVEESGAEHPQEASRRRLSDGCRWQSVLLRGGVCRRSHGRRGEQGNMDLRTVLLEVSELCRCGGML